MYESWNYKDQMSNLTFFLFLFQKNGIALMIHEIIFINEYNKL